MSAYLLFVLLGLGSGAAYAVLGLGLVLKFRSTGVVDFGQGAVAMFGAYVFLELRERGVLQLPWIVLPHQITVADGGIGTWPAMAAALVYSALFGLLLYLLVFRPIQSASALTKVCASVGVMLVLQAVAVLNFGTQGRSTAPILPTGAIEVAGLRVPLDRVGFALVVIALAAGLAVVYRFTRFGLATRAAAENEVGAALTGLSTRRIAAVNWVLGSVLAALAGILISPISTLDPGTYTLFVVPALGAALLARFTSFAVTAAAGLGLGVVQALLTKVVVTWTWLPNQGIAAGLPFIAIMIAMTVFTRRLAARGDAPARDAPSVGRPARPARVAAITFAAGSLAILALHGSLRAALIASLVTACLCLSLVVLTGYIGQVSLAQLSFAGVSAFALTHLTGALAVPFPLGPLLAAGLAVPLGILVGLPALRLRGVNLAIVTLAVAAAMDAIVFAAVQFTGGLAGRTVPPPVLLGWDLSIARGSDYPRAIFGIAVLLVVCLVGLLVARLRSSPAGQMFLAVRSNERAAAAAGIDVARTKLTAFGISSFIAGLGGCLLAYQQGTVSSATFSAFGSLSLLAIAYVAGVGRIAGAVIAGVMLAPDGLFVSFLDKTLNIGAYQTLVAGVALALTAVLNPNGIASGIPRIGVPAGWARRLRERRGDQSATRAPDPQPPSGPRGEAAATTSPQSPIVRAGS
jgi:ABC-type branched-subunit amino acid transport system permease subunit